MNGTSSQATTFSHLETVTEVFPAGSAAPSPQHSNTSVVTAAHLSTPAAADSLSSAPTLLSTTPLQSIPTTEDSTLLTSLATFSSPSTHTEQDASSTAPASTTQLAAEFLTTTATHAAGRRQTTGPGQGLTGPTHQDVPSELNVGDEELKRSHLRSNSPLDPLLAGLLSVFIVTTAIVFVVLFLKFRQRTNHPEFHRLQDLPMDDLMEDTPLSRYTY
ncbi:endochitinase A isoform X2 [Mugil cephalus]|nr:endochitinase A isoform X2 [Mugil cephalus]